MTIQSLITEGAGILLDPENGMSQAVIYYPPGGSPVNLNGIFEEHNSGGELKDNPEGRSTDRVATIECPTKINGEDQSYDVGGSFDIGKETWNVNGSEGRDNDLISVALMNPGSIEVRRNQGTL